MGGLPAGRAQAQFFDDEPTYYRRRPPQRPAFNPFGGFFGGDGFERSERPYRQDRWDRPDRRDRQDRRVHEPRSEPAVDYSHAPPAQKPETPPDSTVLVLGDSMADWLGYGLEEALSDTPEAGVVRKIKTYSGLIHYDSKDDQSWTQVAREAIAAEKPKYIVMMLGVSDRRSIVEKATAKDKTKKAGRKKTADQKSDEQAADQNSSDDPEQPSLAADEPASRAQPGSHEFRSERWKQLYDKRIDDMIAVLKSKGVPVIWVGLPAVRGTKSTSDMEFLDERFRAAADKAGITYVDDWEGFVDDQGRFTTRGPDFDGQIRQLRTSDGVHFTKSGARKLAHYVERELRRMMTSRPIQVSLPTPSPQPGEPGVVARPGVPLSRPLVGPIVPLTALVTTPDTLAGSGSARPADQDPLANRVLMKGEPVAAPAGRADDFAWPRREIANAKSEPTPPELANAFIEKPAPAHKAAAPKKDGSADETAQAEVKPQPAPARPKPRAAPPPPRERAQRPQPFDLFGGGFDLFR